MKDLCGGKFDEAAAFDPGLIIRPGRIRFSKLEDVCHRGRKQSWSLCESKTRMFLYLHRNSHLMCGASDQSKKRWIVRGGPTERRSQESDLSPVNKLVTLCMAGTAGNLTRTMGIVSGRSRHRMRSPCRLPQSSA